MLSVLVQGLTNPNGSRKSSEIFDPGIIILAALAVLTALATLTAFVVLAAPTARIAPDLPEESRKSWILNTANVRTRIFGFTD